MCPLTTTACVTCVLDCVVITGTRVSMDVSGALVVKAIMKHRCCYGQKPGGNRFNNVIRINDVLCWKGVVCSPFMILT
jgi:hypothetical protein